MNECDKVQVQHLKRYTLNYNV